MDRRVFLISALAATATPETPVTPRQTAKTQDPPGTGAPSGDPSFDAWKADFVDRAMSAGWPADLIDREFKALTPEPRVVALDTRQPEFSRPISDYVRGVVTEGRVARGRKFRASLGWLAEVEARYGVPPEIVLAIWAMESGFGADQGSFDVIQALASLAAAGRRRDWAETQIFSALRILASSTIPRERLKGSWAGAMGQTQFIPETYLRAAVDGDGDGVKDVWTSRQDALASAANLLALEGWRRGQAWHREVTLPEGFDYALADGPRKVWAEWAGRGVTTTDGRPLNATEAAAESSVILPAGAKGPALLALPNHFVIRRYNNSVAYALGVGLLADRFGGGEDLKAAWPPEVGLSRAQRTEAQDALKALGFDPGAADGVIGTNTRVALKAWQTSRSLPADGYLSPEMIARLNAELSIPY